MAEPQMDLDEDMPADARHDDAVEERRAAEFGAYIQRARQWDYDEWLRLRAIDKSGDA